MSSTQSHGTELDWAAPSGSVDGPQRRGARQVEPHAVAVATGPATALAGSPVSRLGPRSFRQLLDGGFEVMRFRFSTIAALAAILVMPLVAVPTIVTAIWGAQQADDMFVSSAADPFAQFGDVIGLSSWGWLSASLAHTMLAVAVSFLVASWLVGQDPGIRDALRHTLRRVPVIFVAFAMVSVTKLSILLCGLGLVLLPIWAMLGPVLGAEPLGVKASIGRAWTLGRRRYDRMVGISVGFGVASFILRIAAAIVPAYLGQILGLPDNVLEVLVVAMAIASNVVLAIVLVGITTLTYLDVRVRSEGLDIELGAKQRLDRASR